MVIGDFQTNYWSNMNKISHDMIASKYTLKDAAEDRTSKFASVSTEYQGISD